MKKNLLLVSTVLLLLPFVFKTISFSHNEERVDLWPVESVDTMKYSRDHARAMLYDQSDSLIKDQVSQIAKTGASYIAIATPYDDEFLPVLKRWVTEARNNNLKVWFRGNFSGWEGWFDYSEISRREHLRLLGKFISENANLFEDGDIFSSCPECENGGPGDPRHNGDVDGHRKFLIDEYKVANSAFSSINKKVSANYFSMNGDVANLVMNKETTKSLGGIVVVDHYVATPEKMIKDVRELADRSGGKIVLGEFGNPIPDINGDQTEEQQAEWLNKTLLALSQEPSVVGLNYWTLTGGSTAIYSEGKERKAFDVLSSYYNVKTVIGKVSTEIGNPVQGAEISFMNHVVNANDEGEFALPDMPYSIHIKVSQDGFNTIELDVDDTNKNSLYLTLSRNQEGLLFKIIKFFKNLFK